MSDPVSLLERVEARGADENVALPVWGSDTPPLPPPAPDDTEPDPSAVEAAIHADPTLTAEALREANSPVFVGLREVQTVRGAVERLGFEQVGKLVGAARAESRPPIAHADLTPFLAPMWRQAQGTALAGRWLCERLNYPDLESTVTIGGLLHDVGKLLILRVLDELHATGEATAQLSPALVRELIDATHAEQGAKLLERWHLPEVYCRIARDHHVETVDPADTALLVVRLADRACTRVGLGLDRDPELVLAATDEAACLGASEILLAELEIMLEDSPLMAQGPTG